MIFYFAMVNAWSLAYDVLNGTMDEVYPVMTDNRITPQESDEYDVPESSWVYESPDGGKTVTRRKSGDDYTEKEVITGDYFDQAKPQPDLNYKSQKYQENKGIADLKDYVASTYQGHYTNDNSDVQRSELNSLKQSAVSMSVGQKEAATKIIQDWLDEPEGGETEAETEEG